VKRFESVLCLFVACSALVFAQATATINGRVVDPADAVVPNAGVTVTNLATGVARESTTNAEGLYSVPALTPGNYSVKVKVQGFDTADRENVELLTGSTLSVDFKMQVGAVQQSVEVGAQAALVETSQAVGSQSIRQQDVAALPMLNRSMGALMTMVPGAREITSTGGLATNSLVSIGGGTGYNYGMVVDGMDNKEVDNGGLLIEYSLDGLQEFKTMTTGANAEFGKGAGQILATTRSGTNQFHGSAFYFFRNDSLTKTDFFSLPQNGGVGKAPFSRNQEGGSVGGPIIKDKAFFFGSVERISQQYSLPRSSLVIQQLNYLVPLNIGVLVTPTIAEPNDNLLVQGKVNYNLSARHSAFLRYAQEYYHNQDFLGAQSALLDWAPYQNDNRLHIFDASLGDTFVVSPTLVNQFTAQYISYRQGEIFPHCPLNIPSLGVDSCLGRDLSFPSVSTATVNSFPNYFIWDKQWEFRDDVSKQLGRHALKFGFDYTFFPLFGGLLSSVTPGSVTFFDDPGTIVNNLNGKYPMGFQTPGLVRTVTEWSGVIGNLSTPQNFEAAAYAQDDFKLTPRLTLNLGLRWDAFNLGWGTLASMATNPTYKILKAIGSPYGALPNLPGKKDFQPRVGLAWDLGGNGKNVVRMSYGIFYLEQLKLTNYNQAVLEQPNPAFPQSNTNTGVGVGPLANVVVSSIIGANPLPPINAAPTGFPVGSNETGSWYDPFNVRDGQDQQFHGGWAHIFGGNDVLSVDFTYMLLHHGWRAIDINPLLNGVRPLSALTQSVYGDPKLLGPVFLQSSQETARYKETAVHFEHRFSARSSFQVNYILAWSDGSGGNGDGARSSPGTVYYPQIPSATGGVLTAPWEYGPTSVDERNRVTATGVFNLPFKLELAPSGTWATARPYTLFRATNPSGDGSLQLLNAAGLPAGINTQRGSALFVVNTRVTRNFQFGHDGRFKAGAFAEFYNITNRANFGNIYGGNQFAPATFEKPTNYLGGAGAVSTIPNSFQVQFGGRFTF
jgi:hypothetical protein